VHKVHERLYNVTRWENETFGDIIHLDCKGNLNEGKTYEYFKKVGTEWTDKYTHVMNADDDTFVNIPGDFANFGSNCSSRRSASGHHRQETSILGHLVQGRVEVWPGNVRQGIHSRYGSGPLDSNLRFLGLGGLDSF